MPSQTVTAADGAFLLAGVAAGRWRLAVEKSGYAAQVSTVEVLGGDVQAAPVFLEPAGVLELRVRLADGGAPSSLVVMMMGAGERPLTTRYLRPIGAGRFVLDTLPPGSSELVVTAPEAPPARVRVESPGSADVVLPPSCTLVVRVPELAGDAALQNLAPGVWTVTVTTADGRAWTAAATLSPGAPTRLVIE